MHATPSHCNCSCTEAGYSCAGHSNNLDYAGTQVLLCIEFVFVPHSSGPCGSALCYNYVITLLISQPHLAAASSSNGGFGFFQGLTSSRAGCARQQTRGPQPHLSSCDILSLRLYRVPTVSGPHRFRPFAAGFAAARSTSPLQFTATMNATAAHIVLGSVSASQESQWLCLCVCVCAQKTPRAMPGHGKYHPSTTPSCFAAPTNVADIMTECLLLMVPGAFVPAANFTALAQATQVHVYTATQRRLGQRLWHSQFSCKTSHACAGCSAQAAAVGSHRVSGLDGIAE